MSEFKEEWFSWDGDTENREMSFVQYVKGIRFGDGGVIEEEDIFFYRDPSKIYTLWTDWCKLENTIVAYTLGEKRRRVTCPECQGKGKWKENHWFTRRCGECNGTGKVWEYSE